MLTWRAVRGQHHHLLLLIVILPGAVLVPLPLVVCSHRHSSVSAGDGDTFALHLHGQVLECPDVAELRARRAVDSQPEATSPDGLWLVRCVAKPESGVIHEELLVESDLLAVGSPIDAREVRVAEEGVEGAGKWEVRGLVW